jgi:hypothetical protein
MYVMMIRKTPIVLGYTKRVILPIGHRDHPGMDGDKSYAPS